MPLTTTSIHHRVCSRRRQQRSTKVRRGTATEVRRTIVAAGWSRACAIRRSARRQCPHASSSWRWGSRPGGQIAMPRKRSSPASCRGCRSTRDADHGPRQGPTHDDRKLGPTLHQTVVLWRVAYPQQSSPVTAPPNASGGWATIVLNPRLIHPGPPLANDKNRIRPCRRNLWSDLARAEFGDPIVDARSCSDSRARIAGA